MTHLVRLADFAGRRSVHARKDLFFTRAELMMLMGWHSMAVSKGDWRDYALDHLNDAAMFSVFRHAYEQPLFSIVKSIHPSRKSAVFSLYRGHLRCAQSATLTALIRRMHDKPSLVADT